MIIDDRDRPTDVPKQKQISREDTPAAGPHARPDLTDKDKTPGSGMLPDQDNPGPTG
jgi:hypothetical protein